MAGDEERAALYRTWLTGRRVLIVLDDAKGAAQVTPLLPGSASCAVLVTTRSRTPYALGITGLRRNARDFADDTGPAVMRRVEFCHGEAEARREHGGPGSSRAR